MPIGYGYVNRTADDYVNWASVGKDMSDMLAETNRVREEKKDAIEQATRETLMQLAQSPQGENENARSEILRYANDASERTKLDLKLLKSNQISLKEFTIRRQNINDGTNLAFNANKAYQAQYSEVMNDDTLSDLVKKNFAEVEGFGNWNQSGLYIAPNGTVMAALKTKKIIDGKEVYTMDDTPGKMQSVDSINQMIYGRIKKFDYESPVKRFADSLGVEQKSVISSNPGFFKKGEILTVDDITSRKDIDPKTKEIIFEFQKAEDDAIEAMIGTDTNYASLLVDRVNYNKENKLYDTIYIKEEADKNPNLILKVFDPKSGGYKYEISEKQKNEGREFIRRQMRAQYDYKEDRKIIDEVTPPAQRAPAADKGKKEPQPEISPTPSTLQDIVIGGKIDDETGKKVGGIKVQNGSRSFPISGLTVGDSPSEKDQNAQALIVSPGGKIYLQVSKPNYTKKGDVDADGVPVVSSEPTVSLLDFGKNSTEIGKYARRAGFKGTKELQDRAIELAGPNFITTPNERAQRAPAANKGKKKFNADDYYKQQTGKK